MLEFQKEMVTARIVLPDGRLTDRPIEIRTDPITGRTCRITITRGEEREPAVEGLPEPPPFALERGHCPFCKARLAEATPRFPQALCDQGRQTRGNSVLFPNLFPYGRYSAVSLFDDDHFVEIGTAKLQSYIDSFLNCRDYLTRVLAYDPAATFMAITQNHLPSAGGSLLHPHLQVQADHTPANYQRFLQQRAKAYRQEAGRRLFCDYLDMERRSGQRYIGTVGNWHWLAAFAPTGFYEIWGILPHITRLNQITSIHFSDLAQGVLNAQKFFRSLGRNGYNLGLLLLEDGSDDLELRVVLTVRGNYAAWVRSDFTGFELMLGDMATFSAPELTAQNAQPFWH